MKGFIKRLLFTCIGIPIVVALFFLYPIEGLYVFIIWLITGKGIISSHTLIFVRFAMYLIDLMQDKEDSNE